MSPEFCLVGSGGFKGRPDPDGTVEIGYETRPVYRRRGFATEAVQALISWALSQPAVKRVSAQTRPDNTPSIAVLSKLGFVRSGTASEPQLIRFEFFEPIRASSSSESGSQSPRPVLEWARFGSEGPS